MDENNSIQLFEDRKIRTAWDEEKEEWYFSVQDVVAVLSESTDPKQYIKKMRARDPQLSANWGTFVPRFKCSPRTANRERCRPPTPRASCASSSPSRRPRLSPSRRYLDIKIRCVIPKKRLSGLIEQTGGIPTELRRMPPI